MANLRHRAANTNGPLMLASKKGHATHGCPGQIWNHMVSVQQKSSSPYVSIIGPSETELSRSRPPCRATHWVRSPSFGYAARLGERRRAQNQNDQ